MRISRCLFNVSHILRQMVEAGASAPQKNGVGQLIPGKPLTHNHLGAACQLRLFYVVNLYGFVYNITKSNAGTCCPGTLIDKKLKVEDSIWVSILVRMDFAARPARV